MQPDLQFTPDYADRNTRSSQNAAILNYMLAGNRISPLVALEMFGCMRLGGRKYDLLKLGWNVQTDIVKRNGKRFAEYWIPKDKPRIT
jgi:hypothetical protein